MRTTEKTFVIGVKDGVAQWVDVKTGATANGLIEVLGQIGDGDIVVVRGTDELRNGSRIASNLH